MDHSLRALTADQSLLHRHAQDAEGNFQNTIRQVHSGLALVVAGNLVVLQAIVVDIIIASKLLLVTSKMLSITSLCFVKFCLYL